LKFLVKQVFAGAVGVVPKVEAYVHTGPFSGPAAGVANPVWHPVVALEMVQALATGTTVPQDRINRPSGGSRTPTLHPAPCLGEMRCTMRRASNPWISNYIFLGPTPSSR